MIKSPIVNRAVPATYYSLVGAEDAVLLVARWMDDWPTGASCWIELDREPLVTGENTNAAWDRLRERSEHLLPMPK